MRMRRKAWTEPELAACPYFVEKPSTHKGTWSGLFEKKQPVYLEIGCGKGVATVKLAHENPGINLIAIDEVRHVLAVSIRNCQKEYGEEEPKNLLFSAVDAMSIFDTFSSEDGIERIYINFCNPWDEKAKHHKRRLTHPRQLNQYHDFLKPGGEIWFKTDNDALFTASKRYFSESGFEITYLTDDLHASGFTPNYVSEHEALYTSRGMRIHFMIAKMAPLTDAASNTIKDGGNTIMSNFFETNRECLDNFTRVSCDVGARADYVQGGGGNTSAKLADGLMAIKASGYCLKDIRPDTAYAVLDYEALRAFYNGSNPTDFEDVEKAGSEEAKKNTKQIEGLAALRPSVEAGFHSILDTYVAHSHSVYANLAACCQELKDIAAKALADADYTWGWVEYTDPGARLTFSIRDELKRVEAETGRRPAAIFMQNHGLIAHSDDPDECLRIHTDVNNRIAKAFGINNGDFPAVSVKELDNGLVEAVCPYLTEQLASGKFSEKFLLESPLYPDQLVFLTGSFSFSAEAPEEGMAAVNPATGALVFNMPASKAQVIAETITAVVYICNIIEKNGYTLSTMGEAAKNFIANWESEKYRKSLAGKK
ncbi:MAG: tRNA (guanosine(46)-N7)-methyltransferase TrmB [Clostridia bacterium]|nr:tRNA (guanosine(46)-N7)-methyltransferase TrmB [Clostridia bacterium]